MAHKVPLTNLVLMDSNLYPYLVALLVVAIYKAGVMIRVPKKGNAITLKKKKFENFLVNRGSKIYDNYGILARYYCLHPLFEEPEE